MKKMQLSGPDATIVKDGFTHCVNVQEKMSVLSHIELGMHEGSMTYI